MSQPTRSETVLACWLIPALPAREFFQVTIGRLAAQFDAPLFEPHLTIAVVSDSGDEPERTLTGLTAAPIALPVRGVDFTAKFTQTLFVRFESNPELEQLRDSLGRENCGAQPFDPHLSLLYKKLPVTTQTELAAATEIPFVSVRFDTFRIVRCRLPVASPADVSAWEVVASQSLAL